MSKIRILRSGNRIVVDPTDETIYNLLVPELSFIEKKFYYGYERKQRTRAGKLPFEEITWDCFSLDHKQRIASPFGLIDRIYSVLTGAGYSVTVEWATSRDAEDAEQRAQTVYAPQWDRIDRLVEKGFEFRYRQREVLQLFADHENGRISAPPAYGKGTLFWLACELYPKAKFIITTKRVAVLQQRLYPELAMSIQSVGMVGGQKNRTGQRVMCYTAGSLHKAKPDVDFVLVDEGHEACASKFSRELMRFDRARIWMASATWDMRLDNRELFAEAIAGPVRLTITDEEAVAEGVILPMEVHLSHVVMDRNPCEGLSGPAKEQKGIWANEYRNAIIAQDARSYPDDQVLITVATIEHALYLQRHLPEFKLVYAGNTVTYDRLRQFRNMGLVDGSWEPLSDERRTMLTDRFSAGKLRKVIATPVWNVGVNFHQLQVLIRADAGSSRINANQLPGRTRRLHDASGKSVGILRDYLDEFDTGFMQKATTRIGTYEGNHWVIHYPDDLKRRARK